MHRWILSASLGFCLMAGHSAYAQSDRTPTEPADLQGLWGAHPVFGPRLQGDLFIRQTAAGWNLQLGGLELEAPPQAHGPLSWAFPDGLGEFRGSITPEGPHLFWIQPGQDGPAYATPVRLMPMGPGMWMGRVDPLPVKMSLYLHIKAQPDGTLRGSFHNPEARWTGGLAWFRVEPTKESIRLVDPATGKARFEQAYDPEHRRITFDFGSPFQLAPLNPSEAPGFAPRVPNGGPYIYRRPLPLLDGWETATSDKVGLNSERLQALVRTIQALDPLNPASPRPHSLLVARKGKLALEEYFFGYQASDQHDLRSASKTLTSILLGSVLDRHPEWSAQTPVMKPFNRSGSSDPRKQQITLAQALSHTTGLASDDNDSNSPGEEDHVQATSKDWIATTLELPMAHTPGEHYAYSSMGINLAMGAVGRITHRWIPEVFDEYLARPLGIDHYHINLMPNGEAYGGGGMHLRPRDFLKFGQLFLDQGRWRGKPVLSASWVKASTAPHAEAPDGSTDGWGWHRHIIHAGDRSILILEANGNGGQFLFVVPAYDLTMVMTAGNYNQYGVWRRFREEWLPQVILASAP